MTDDVFDFGTGDARDFAVRGSAVLGIRDSGKTYTATLIAERLFDAGIPFIAFDPIGVWRFLRTPGAGKGYPVVVAGGQEGDLPLSVESAPEIVRAAMKGGVSLVIDLFDVNLSKADWRRIVTSCVVTLLHENAQYGLRHVFLEEAAEFIPQKPQDFVTYAEVEKLARMGGNSRLGLTIINQRAEEVAKAVLELCDNLFLHRQKGRNSLNSLSKWLDVANVANGKEITNSLSTLPTGECWAWLNGSERPVLVDVPRKNSLHPDRRALQEHAGHETVKPVDASQFVETIKAALEKTARAKAAAEQAKATSDSASINRSKKGSQAVPPDPAEIAAAEQRGYEHGKTDGYAEGWRSADADWRDRLSELLGRETPPQRMPASSPSKEVEKNNTAPARPPRAKIPAENPSLRKTAKIEVSAGLTPSLQRVLDAIAWWRALGIDPVQRSQVAAIAGISPTGSTLRKYIGELVSSSFVQNAGEGIVKLSPAGVAASNAETFGKPSAGRIVPAARAQLTPAVATIFDAIVAAYPKDIERSEVAEATGIDPRGSTLRKHIGVLSALAFVTLTGTGRVRAADWLFPKRRAS